MNRHDDVLVLNLNVNFVHFNKFHLFLLRNSKVRVEPIGKDPLWLSGSLPHRLENKGVAGLVPGLRMPAALVFHVTRSIA